MFKVIFYIVLGAPVVMAEISGSLFGEDRLAIYVTKVLKIWPSL